MATGRRMSPPAFETHAGAGSNKKWRHSLRVPSAGNCSINRWLLARGIIPPGTRTSNQEGAGAEGGTKKARVHAGGEGGAGGWGGASGGGRGAGRPAKRTVWKASDVLQLLSTLQLCEGSQRHAQTLADMLAAAVSTAMPTLQNGQRGGECGQV